MKLKLFIISFLLVTNAFSNTLPLSWITENENGKVIFIEEQTQHYIENILDIHSEVLEEIHEQKQLGFKMNQMVTDFSVSKSGLLGLSALKAKKAVEFKWKKKSSSKEINEADIVIDVADDKMDIEAYTYEIYELARASKKVKKTKYLRSHIRNQLKKVNTILEGIDVKEFGHWKLDGLRVDLNISGEGKVTFLSKFGMDLRVRLDFKINQKNKSSMVTSSSQINDFTKKILSDLEASLSQYDFGNYQVKKVNIGLGLSHKRNIFGLSSSKMGFIGYFRFKPIAHSLDSHSIALESEYDYIDDEEVEKGNMSILIGRKTFRSGIKKSLDILSFFSHRKERKGHWELSEIKSVFELTKSGFLGLASTSSTSLLEIELKRK